MCFRIRPDARSDQAGLGNQIVCQGQHELWTSYERHHRIANSQCKRALSDIRDFHGSTAHKKVVFGQAVRRSRSPSADKQSRISDTFWNHSLLSDAPRHNQDVSESLMKRVISEQTEGLVRLFHLTRPIYELDTVQEPEEHVMDAGSEDETCQSVTSRNLQITTLQWMTVRVTRMSPTRFLHTHLKWRKQLNRQPKGHTPLSWKRRE
ncbi:hypothetical protein BJ741DRAFT_415889 [Chytriomyces cf. hyalinus JEL632]|nr:hypothetical protein BJ741DRAFT_415889 [Chytriomyces cf. hyalinus JEL632]